MSVKLTPRLQTALEMLRGLRAPVDIGCDHGYLTAALLADGCERVAACDISAPSLEKARYLMGRRGDASPVTFCLGSGFSCLPSGPWDGAALLGMGGELIARLLEEGELLVHSMDRVVLQPMGGEKELRTWLYIRGWHIHEDVLVREGRRYYQVICASWDGKPDSWPEEFPQECFLLGYKTFADGDPLLKSYCQKLLEQRQRRLAMARGTSGEAKLEKERQALAQILCAMMRKGDRTL